MRRVAAFVIASTTACAVVPPPSAPTTVKADPVEELKAKTVALVDEQESHVYCTGVWVSPSSVLTAYHCTHDGEPGDILKVVVERDVFDKGSFDLRDEISLRPAELYAADPAHDLALLRVTQVPSHAVARVSAVEPVAGLRVYGMGHSLGLWWSYSSGDVAAVRYLETNTMSGVFVQTTTPTSPGNSGGGLFNADGELVGVAHATVLRGQNVNLFIHPLYIRAMLKAQGKDL